MEFWANLLFEEIGQTFLAHVIILGIFEPFETFSIMKLRRWDENWVLRKPAKLTELLDLSLRITIFKGFPRLDFVLCTQQKCDFQISLSSAFP